MLTKLAVDASFGIDLSENHGLTPIEGTMQVKIFVTVQQKATVTM